MNRKTIAVSAVVVAALACGVAACGGGHDATWQQGYSYGQSAARQDYTGPAITGAAAGDACNHSLSAVPDGFGDPSSQDWTSGFMAGCENALSVTRTAPASAAAAGSPAPPAGATSAAATPAPQSAGTGRPASGGTCWYTLPQPGDINVVMEVQPATVPFCYRSVARELDATVPGGTNVTGPWRYAAADPDQFGPADGFNIGGCSGQVFNASRTGVGDFVSVHLIGPDQGPAGNNTPPVNQAIVVMNDACNEAGLGGY